MRLSPSLALSACCLAASALSGCAHDRETMTFAEAGMEDEEPTESPAPPVADAAPEKVAAEPAAGPSVDLEIFRFSAEARVRRMEAGARRGFPPDALAAWDAFAAGIEGYLARPLPQTPLEELSRVLAALETEMEWDRRRYGEPPDSLSRSIEPLSRRLRARLQAARSVRALAGSEAPASPPLHWPVDRAGISSLFGLRLHPIDHAWKMHWGLDLAAPKGEVVGAAAAGWVVHAGWSNGYGLMVEVRHRGGLTTRYSHLARITCSPGDAVEIGQPLGRVGASGKATGPHLHFEVWREGRPRDPLAMLTSGALGAGAP